jgi:hypothetical protein
MRGIGRISIGLFLFPLSLMALMAGPITLRGQISKFDEKTVTVQTSDVQMDIPREYFTNPALRPGSSVEVLLNPKQFQRVKFRKSK